MIRLLRKPLAVLGLLLVLSPVASFGQDLPLELPIGKRVNPGISFVQYAGQTFRFATLVPVNVSFEMVSATVIHLKFVGAPEATSGALAVYWVNFQTDIYDGTVPVGDPWEGDLSTESGFVDR
jgi:hypothetical protein